MTKLAVRLMVLALILAALLVPAVSAQDAATVVIAPGEDVVLALAAGLSGEGIAPLGIDIQRGAELANEDRPSVIVSDVEFGVVVQPEDDTCSAEGGQAVANRLVADTRIVGVIGHMCSSAAFAGAPIYDAAGYTTISPSATNPSLTTSGFTSFNRAVPSDAFQGAVAAEYVYDVLGITRVATIHDGSAYGEGLVQVMTARFTELGGEVVAADSVTVGDTDFRALLETIAAAEPELIYFGGFPAEGARLIQQRADVGLEGTLFMGADGIKGTEVIELAGDAAEGIYASSAIPAASEELDAFRERYVETYGEEPPAPFNTNSYDAYNIFLDAIEATATVDADGNLVIDRAALAEYVRNDVVEFEGLTGVLTADGTGEMATAIIGFAQVQDGVFVDLDMMMEEMEMTPEATPGS